MLKTFLIMMIKMTDGIHLFYQNHLLKDLDTFSIKIKFTKTKKVKFAIKETLFVISNFK